MYKSSTLKILLTILLYVVIYNPAISQVATGIPLYDSISDYKNEIHLYDAGGNLTHISGTVVPRLIVYKPDSACGTAIIICPGGGYARLNVENTRFIAERLNCMGITVFVLVYRLPAANPMPDKALMAIRDVQQAFSLIRSRVNEWGLSPDKIGLWGSSAGGHLAAMAATYYSTSLVQGTDPSVLRPDFLILAWPVISLRTELVHKGSMKNLLGENPSEKQIGYFSPDERVSISTPVTFLVHAGDDKSVPVGNSIGFYQALKKSGVPSELHIYEKGGHGFGIAPDIQDTWMNVLESWLKSRKLL